MAQFITGINFGRERILIWKGQNQGDRVVNWAVFMDSKKSLLVLLVVQPNRAKNLKNTKDILRPFSKDVPFTSPLMQDSAPCHHVLVLDLSTY